MRTRITLECTECKQRNYNMTKDKKTHPERMETKKYCRFCKNTRITKRPNKSVRKEVTIWERNWKRKKKLQKKLVRRSES